MTAAATVFTLASVLDAAGLAGPEPIRAARALLLASAGDDPGRRAANDAMIVRMVRRLPVAAVRAMFADAAPEAAMLVLARLVAAGVPEDEVLGYLPERRARAA